MLGLDAAAPDFSFPVAPQAATRIDALLDYYDIGKTKPLVVMAPGTNWDTKAWRKDGFAEVARHFLSKGSAVVLIGTDSERALCEEVAKLAPGAVDLAGETTLPELAALIRRATLCIANDSGPMHLAVAEGRPVIGLFGPTDSVWAGPYQRSEAVLRVELACSPCYLRRLRRLPERSRLHEKSRPGESDRACRCHHRQAAGPHQRRRAGRAAALIQRGQFNSPVTCFELPFGNSPRLLFEIARKVTASSAGRIALLP